MATRVLLVKTSSLGDVIHALPAVSDMRAAMPALQIDWLVEESLAAIPTLHAGVAAVIPVAWRRWRRGFWHAATRREITGFLARLREHAYDAVIDAQGLFKSAALAFCARGRRYGLDLKSAREPVGLFYQQRFRVGWHLHAVERNRLLVAGALGYTVEGPCAYGLGATPCAFDWLTHPRYAVLLHATSGDYKLWPEDHWVTLAGALHERGVRPVLTWGHEREHARCLRLAARMNGATIAPALDFGALAGLFAGAYAVIGVDTGLTHLAAALGVPTVGVYVATDPAATGLYGGARACNVGTIGSLPAVAEVMMALEKVCV